MTDPTRRDIERRLEELDDDVDEDERIDTPEPTKEEKDLMDRTFDPNKETPDGWDGLLEDLHEQDGEL